MPTLDQKKAKIEVYLAEKDAAKRLELDNLMKGKTKAREIIVPVVFTFIFFSLLILLGITQNVDSSFPGILIFFWIMIISWHQLDISILNKRIDAVQKYYDQRLSEFSDQRI
jgi:glycerol uptake facilitator-like aquaporin